MQSRQLPLVLLAAAAILLADCIEDWPEGTFEIRRVAGSDRAVLAWHVKDGDLVCAIEPDIGKVPCEGSADVPAEPVITYVLKARRRGIHDGHTTEFRARLPAQIVSAPTPQPTP